MLRNCYYAHLNHILIHRLHLPVLHSIFTAAKPQHMKWVQVNSNTPAERFELWNGDSKVAGASFNNASRIVRMASNAGKRLFFYGKKGWFAPKSFIKNEYGITLGKLETETSKGEKGHIELDGKKYYYRIDDNTHLEVFDEEMINNVATCSFGNVLSKSFTKTNTLMNTRFPQLLLLLCWYSLNMHHSGSQQPAAIS